MLAPEPRTGAEPIYLQLDVLSKKLIGLPDEILEQIDGDLQKLRSSINDLIQTDDTTSEELREARERAIWLARFPDENPHPVAQVSVGGQILYCNQVSTDPSGWAFHQSEQIGEPFFSLLREANLLGKQTERVVQIGKRFYSITFMPYPGDQYVNLYGLDITERARAETAIRESENRFRVMADGTPAIIWVTNVDGSMEFINQAYTEFFGVTLEQVQTTSWTPLVYPEDIPGYVSVFLQCTREQKPFRAQARVRRCDGQWRWVDSHGQPQFSESGEFLGMVGSSLDITERKQAEEALEKAYHDLTNERSRLLAVMEALPVGITILDRQGGIIQTNREYEAIWGGPPPITQSVDDYATYQAWWVDTGLPIKPEEWAAAQAVQKGETVTGQFLQIQRFDGRRAFVLNSAAPILDANEAIVGSTVAIMDITQRIEAENALRESQDRFRAAVSTGLIMVYTCDRELRYTWIYNPLRDFRVEDVLGKRDDELLPQTAAAELIAAKQLALETGQARTREVKVPLNGQDTYYILTTDPISDPQGNVTGLACSAIDITDQKCLQREQQEQAIQIEVQRRLMEQREQDRQAIAQDLHDGPIQTLSSSMFHLFMIKQAFPDPKLQEELNLIRTDLKNTIHQLRDTLNVLRPPTLMHFGFSKVVKMYMEDFHIQYPDIEMNIDIETNDKRLSSDTHLTLYRIFQAGMNNIILHAEATEVWVAFKIEPENFILTLQDNGKGFEVKNDFSQLTRSGHFGLVGMKERAEVIGAELILSSEPGKGTTIVVRGPLNG